MSAVLIAGCGYVGAATADLFHDHGWQVEGWTASAESARALADKPYRVRAVNLTQPLEDMGEFDVIIHSASSRGGGPEEYRRIYLEGARHLASAFPRARLIFTSSTSVYAQTTGEWVTESNPAEPLRETGRVLREAEELVLARGGAVARLGGIYGPGRSALLKKFLAGEAVIESPNERFINQVHRDDVASALLLLGRGVLANEATARWIFNVTDSHPLTQRECYEWLAAHLHRAVPPTAPAPAFRKRGNSNKRVRSDKLEALGWRPRYPTFQSAMRESILPAAGL